MATEAARLNRKNLHQGGKRKNDRKRKIDLTLTGPLMEGTTEYPLQRPAIPGYKGNVSSEELLMKRSAVLMLGLFLVLGIAFSCLTVGNSLFHKSLRRAREAVLKSDLAHMRKSIDDYTRDRQQAPQSFQDLV